MTTYSSIRTFQESQRLELKEQLPENLEKEAVAFLNASGGELIIGVQDNGAVVGVKKYRRAALRYQRFTKARKQKRTANLRFF